MSKSHCLRRIQADIRELSLDPSDRYYAAPIESDMLEWHFTIRGADGTDFADGWYHGRILLPPDYPFKPPHIVFLTPSGRFETNTKVCLSFSAFHPELWQPAWGIRLILEALIAFLPTPADGAIGALDWSGPERRRLAARSRAFCCPCCGPVADIVDKVQATAAARRTSETATTPAAASSTLRFQKEIETLQLLQQQEHKVEQDAAEDSEQQTTTDEDRKVSHDASRNAAAEPTAEISSLEATNVAAGAVGRSEADQDENDIGDTKTAAQSPPGDVAHGPDDASPPFLLSDPILNAIIFVELAILYLLFKKWENLFEELYGTNE